MVLHVLWYIHLKWSDMIQWLEINIVMFFCVKNAYFCAVVEEVKHWKCLTHWPTQTFRTRPLFSLCGPQTPTENLSFSWCFPAVICRYLQLRCRHNTRARNIREWTGVTFTAIYHYKCEKYIHKQRLTEYVALILRIDSMIFNEFCFEKWFLDRYRSHLKDNLLFTYRCSLIVGI